MASCEACWLRVVEDRFRSVLELVTIRGDSGARYMYLEERKVVLKTLVHITPFCSNQA